MADKTVTVRVISDTPVDRVYKGDTLSLPEAIANQFIEKELVELVEEEASELALESANQPQKSQSLRKHQKSLLLQQKLPGANPTAFS